MEIYMVSYWEAGESKHTRVFNNFAKASAYYNDLYSEGAYYNDLYNEGWNTQIDLCEFIDGELKSVHTMASNIR